MKSIAIILALSCLLAASGCGTPESSRAPNIVLILADDVGTEVIGSYGGTSYATPNIDELARTGMRFTHTYSAPVCSPSRVKLMTGRYGFRTGQAWGQIPDDEVTFGHLAKNAGYEVVLAGKWQMALLKDRPDHIREMGFDTSAVFGWHEGPRYYEPLIYEDGRVREDLKDRYGPDYFSDFLLEFIERNKDRPFFAYYPMVLAHEISNDLPYPPPKGPSGRYESYRQNVEYADTLIGDLVRKLDALGLRESTLILYVGDNGTPHHYITDYSDGEYVREPVFSAVGDTTIQGGKSYLTDRGTHVPFIANWRGVISPGTVSDVLIDFSDFLPTVVELIGAATPRDRFVDGHSFAPLLIGEDFEPRSWAYQEWEGRGWIRTQDWKLYFGGNLFDMRNDAVELNPIREGDDSEESAAVRAFLADELARLRRQ